MCLTTAYALEEDLGHYLYILGYPEKRKHPSEDGIVVLQQIS